MRHVVWLLLAAMIALGLLAVGAFAQAEATPDQSTVSQSQTTVEPSTTTGPAAMVPGTVAAPPGMVTYVPSAEATLTGTVTTAPMLAAPTDMDFQMMIQTPDGVQHRVWLAPAGFLRRNRFAPAVNDQVTVIGMPIGTSGDVVARQITWGGRSYALRNAQGVPMWQRRMERRGMREQQYAYGTGRFRSYSGLFSPNRVQTVSGRIDRIGEYHPSPGMGPGIEIRIRSAGLEPEDIPSWQLPAGGLVSPEVWVHLGPRWYVERQFPDLHTGQQVTVTGAPVVWRDEPILIASSMQVGSRAVAFRGPTGYPMWAGGWQAWSQGPMVSGMPTAALPTMGAFQTITGTIQKVQNLPAMGSFGPSMLVSISTANNCTANVVIAPDTFSQQVGVTLTPGQEITIVAAPATINGQAALIANQVGYNGQTFVMSNVNGAYSWSTATGVASLPPAGAMSPGY